MQPPNSPFQTTQSPPPGDCLPQQFHSLRANLPKRPWGVIAMTLAAVGALVPIFLVGGSLLNSQPAPALPPRAAESVAKKNSTSAEAFSAKASSTAGSFDSPKSHPAHHAVHRAITRLVLGQHKYNLAEIADCFDCPRLFQEIERQGMLPRMSARDRGMFIRELEKIIPQATADRDENSLWKSFEILRLQPAEHPDELIAYVRSRDGDGFDARTRLWLRRSGDEWKFFDSEDLDTCLRLSNLYALLAGSGLSRSPAPWVSRVEELMSSIGAILDQPEDVLARLQALASNKFPPAFEAIRLMGVASCHIMLDDFVSAGHALTASQALNPDAPILDYMRAKIDNRLGRHEPALRSAQRYIDLLGSDADVQIEVGLALLGLERADDAADAFRRGLNERPGDLDCLLGLARSLPDDRTAEIGERLAACAEPAASFESLAPLLLDEGLAAALESLCDTYEQIAPRDFAVAYYRAQALIDREEYDAAIELLTRCLPNVSDDRSADFIGALQSALLASGRPLDAYRADEDAARSFLAIANAVSWEEDADALQAVIAEHERAVADDRWLPYYRGELAMLHEDFPAAVLAYKSGRALARDAEERSAYEHQLLYAMCRDGRIGDVWKEVAFTKETARQVGWLCIDEENAADLSTLSDDFKSRHPADVVVSFWNAHLAFWELDYDRAVEILQARRADLASDNELMPATQHVLVRSLIRLRRFDDALAAAQDASNRGSDPYFEVIVNAVAGQVEPTQRAFEKCIELGYAPDFFYEDPDAGPALRSEEFRELTDRHPRRFQTTSAQQSDPPM